MARLIPPRTAIRMGVLPALLCCLVLGCGGKGYRVSGKVTYKGQPVPAGKIYFNPDGSKGNSGQGGYADIKDGTFDTSAAGGRGAAGGPTIVVIEGIDPHAPPDKSDKSGEVTAKALFARYETAVDLPRSDSKKDFDVPASAGTAVPKGGGPAIVP